MEISEVIKNIRSQLSLSQEGLARELHMGFTSVNRWETINQNPIRLQDTLWQNFAGKII